MSIDELLKATKSSSAKERQRAVKGLANTSDSRVFKALMAAIEDPDDLVSKLAAQALAEDDRGLAELSRFLHQKSYPANKLSVAIAARKALVNTLNPKAIEYLISFLDNSMRNIWMRSEDAESAIIKFGLAAVPPLLAAIGQANPDVPKHAVSALGRIGAPAVPLLVEGLKSEVESIRIAAATALGDIGETEAVQPLLATLSDSPISVIAAVLEALGRLGDLQALDPLILFTRHQDPLVRKAAVIALGNLGDAAATELLIALLGDDDIRRHAVNALAKLGTTISLLFQKLGDPTEAVRLGLAELLARAGREGEKLALVALADEKWQVRQAAATCLGYTSYADEYWESEGFSGVNGWRHGYTRYEENRWEEFFKQIPPMAYFRSPLPPTTEVVLALLKAMEDRAVAVRRAAALSLGRIPALTPELLTRIVQSLSEMLERPREPARQAAAAGLLALEDTLYWLKDRLSVEGDTFYWQEYPSYSDRDLPEVTLPEHKNRIEIADALIQSVNHPVAPVRLAGVLAMSRYVASVAKRDSPAWESRSSALVESLVKSSRDSLKRIREPSIAALAELDSIITFKHETLSAEPIPLSEKAWRELMLASNAREAAQRRMADSAKRYNDVTLYELTDGKNRQIKPGEDVKEEQPYLLEVAIRLEPIGLFIRDREPILEPASTSDVTLWITAESRGFQVDQPVQTLTLSPSGDSSKNAWFKIVPDLKTSLPVPGNESPKRFPPFADTRGVGEIRLRLYYEFNLLDVVVLRAGIIAKFEKSSEFGRGVQLHQERKPRSYVDLKHVHPRSMNIDITRQDGDFNFHFGFRNETNDELEFVASSPIQTTDLERQLEDVRKVWYGIAMSDTFSQSPEGHPTEFLENMRLLARAGRNLWVSLFTHETRSAQREKPSMLNIGRWLEEHPLPKDSTIQVCVEPKAREFIIPWSLLYDRPVPKKPYELPDPEGFWGLRYSIEQMCGTENGETDEPLKISDQLKIAFMLWDQFSNANKQKDLMKMFQQEAGNWLEITDPPITEADVCYELLADCAAHVLYFYAHGFTRPPDKALATLEMFIRNYERKKFDPSELEDNRLLYESIKTGLELERSWIELTYGRLYLDELREEVLDLHSRPVVILNMCQSAQVTPSVSESFVQFFLDRGSRAVIGTECPMTTEFAHPFGESFLTHLLAGEPIGKALLYARRRSIAMKNPLGLAYTLFGSAMVSFQPPRIERSGSTLEGYGQPKDPSRTGLR